MLLPGETKRDGAYLKFEQNLLDHDHVVKDIYQNAKNSKLMDGLADVFAYI